MPGFVRLLDAIDDAWRNRRGELARAGRAAPRGDRARARASAARARAVADRPGAARPTRSPTSARQFDPRFGGFGRAPKFPQAMTLTFLLDMAARHGKGTPNADVLDMITVSLDAMAAGGMYDQVGGGFHRYSVDAHWLVPALREDALRPGPARAGVPPRLAGHRRGRATGASSRRRSPTCCATSATPTAASSPPRTPTPKGSRASSTCGPTTELEALAGRRPDRARPPLRRDDARQLRRPAHRLPRATSSMPSAAPTCAPKRSTACCRRCSPPGAAGRAPGSTTRCCWVGTRCSCASLAEAADALGRADWMDAARTNARFLLARAPARRRPVAAVVAGRPRQPARLRRGLRRAARGADHPRRGRRRRVARRGARRSPTASSRSSPTTNAAGSSPPAPTPTR